MPKVLKSGKLSFSVKEKKLWETKVFLNNPEAFFLKGYRKQNLRQEKFTNRNEERYSQVLEFGLFSLSSTGRLVSWDGDILNCMDAIVFHPWENIVIDALRQCRLGESYTLVTASLTKDLIKYIGMYGRPNKLRKATNNSNNDPWFVFCLLQKNPVVTAYLTEITCERFDIDDLVVESEEVFVSQSGKPYYNVLLNKVFSIHGDYFSKLSLAIIDKTDVLSVYLPFDEFEPIVIAEQNFKYGCVILPDLGKY